MTRKPAAAALLLALGGSLLVATPADAAGNVRAAISLSAPASGVYGSTITLRGKLWRSGSSVVIRGATVWLQRTPHGRRTWVNVKNTRTGSTGTFAFGVTQVGAYDYRAYFAGSRTFTRAWSAVRYPVTTQKVVLDAIGTANADTGVLRATGRVWPVPPNGTRVWLQRWTGRAWENLATGSTSSGRATVLIRRPGSVAPYRLVVGPRGSYGAGVSASRAFAHYVWRGAFARPVLQVFGSDHGSFEVQNSSEARLYSARLGRLKVRPSTAGCLQARSITGHLYSTDGNTSVALNVDFATRVSGTFGPGQSVPLGVGFDAGSVFDYWVEDLNSSSGLNLSLRLQLLCAN